MRPRVAVPVAWSICLAAVTLGLIGVALGLGLASDRQGLVLSVGVVGVMSVVYPIVGAVIASRKPDSVIGWLLCSAGLSMSVVGLAAAYGMHGHRSVGQYPGAEIAAWLASWAFVPALALSAAILLFLFPTGAPPSRRWRPAVIGVAIASLITAVGYAFRPGRLAVGAPIDNPLGIQDLGDALALLARAGDVLFPLALLLAAASMITRYRGAGVEERQQLKWFAYAATTMVIAFAVAALPLEPLMLIGWTVGSISLAALPVTVLIAVFKYRLYDIDLIINRTLVYITLLGFLGGLYTASIAFFQRLFVAFTGNTSDAAIVITALVLAGVFTPVRKSLETIVDRRFNPRNTRDAPPPPVGTEGAPIRTAATADLVAIQQRLDAFEKRLAELETVSPEAEVPRRRSG
jgi:hypothetical protein